MSREDFRRSIFDIVEYLTGSRLTKSGKELIVYYFNNSKARTSRLKALEVIEKYYPESIPDEAEMPLQLKDLLDTMFSEAEKWDSE